MKRSTQRTVVDAAELCGEEVASPRVLEAESMKAGSDVVTPSRQSVGYIRLKLMSLLMSSTSPRVSKTESMKALELLLHAAMHLLFMLTSNRLPPSVGVDVGTRVACRV